METSVNWKQVGLFLALTFGLSWLLDLVLALTVGYGHPATVLFLQVQMLLPASCAIVLEMFVFKHSALYAIRLNKEKPRYFYYFFLTLTAIFIVLAVLLLVLPDQTILMTFSLLTQALMALGLVVLLLLRWISGHEAFARAHLSGGGWWLWVIYGAAFVLFYGLQTFLNWLFGLGSVVDVQAVMAQSLPPEAQMQMSPLLFLLAAGLQSVLLGGLLGLLISFGEEYGWRGYLQRELVKVGRVRGILLLGVVWGLWHAPVIWMGHNYPGYPMWGTLLMVLYSTGLAFVLGYAVLKTGSVLLAAFLHAVNNQVYSFLTVLVYQPDDPIFSFGGGIYGILTLALVVLLLLRDPIWRQPSVTSEHTTKVDG